MLRLSLTLRNSLLVKSDILLLSFFKPIIIIFLIDTIYQMSSRGAKNRRLRDGHEDGRTLCNFILFTFNIWC